MGNKYDLLKKIRIGETKYNNSGDLMKIIKYNGSQDVIIEFQDQFQYQMKVDYGNFTKGTVKNPYHPFLYNKGYIGVGNYSPTINGKPTIIYDAWRKMFDRCYNHKYNPTYNQCEVCEEWFNFQNFAEWYDTHYWEDENYPMQLDKDWLIFGNKIYSPDTCEIVPSIINSCIVTHNKRKDFDLPINIKITTSKKYRSRLSKYGKRVDLGSYSNIVEAMKIYKKSKIQYIQELAMKYKNKISSRLYNTMINYEERFNKEFPEYAEI